jgi:hypothetical protein
MLPATSLEEHAESSKGKTGGRKENEMDDGREERGRGGILWFVKV